MTPQAGEFIAKAHRALREARMVLQIGLNEAAGRAAYMAAYHTAQAVIFEDRASAAKTHAGVQIEFQRITKDDPRVDSALRRFLSQAYNLKGVADYETGPESDVTVERASAAVDTAQRFIKHFTQILEQSKPT